MRGRSVGSNPTLMSIPLQPPTRPGGVILNKKHSKVGKTIAGALRGAHAKKRTPTTYGRAGYIHAVTAQYSDKTDH